QVRMNQFFERVEAALRQSLKLAVEQGATGAEFDPLQRAQLLAAYVSGCLFLFARTGPGCMSANSVERSLRVLLA
ncbi:MAG: nucleoid occlusion factor SlmA, partial [Thiomonas delicata]